MVKSTFRVADPICRLKYDGLSLLIGITALTLVSWIVRCAVVWFIMVSVLATTVKDSAVMFIHVLLVDMSSTKFCRLNAALKFP